MMPAAKSMCHTVPSHVLRVGQTVRLEAGLSEAGGNFEDPDLNISLDNLNQLILELDPTFEPLQVPRSPPTDSSWSEDDGARLVLVPRGCSAETSPGVPIPARGCSPGGTRLFSGSPTASLPPLPCGSAPRRHPSRLDLAFPQGSLRLCHSNRNSASSLLSTSSCSDTSYVLGSNLSLAGEDADSPESVLAGTSGSSRHSPEKRGHVQEARRSADVPVLLVNGAPHFCSAGADPEPTDFTLTLPASHPKPPSPRSFQGRFHGSQPSMKFVMDTSKFWFRPHISRAEADALVKDKEPGTFVIRDSTSYRGSFGLAMKVNQSPSSLGAAADPGEGGSDGVRHFLIESSAKGVRVKGSSQEPYFGSLSALVYQHTVSAYALPCRLLLRSQDPGAADEGSDDKPASEDQSKTACNLVYLNAVATETLTGPCAVQKAVSSTLGHGAGSFAPTVVNLKASLKGVTLTDVNRKLFFRRHYPAHLLSYCGEDPDSRRWMKGSSFGARMFGFVAKGAEVGLENVCHIFAEHDPLQPCTRVVEVVRAAIAKP